MLGPSPPPRATAPIGAGGRTHRGVPALTAPGSDPSALPGNLLIADKGNNRLIEIDPRGRTVWSFPRRRDRLLAGGFSVPDDAFFSADGSRIVATQEEAFAISVIDPRSHRIVSRYGTPGVPGAAANELDNPDDALLYPNGSILAADIKNCRLVEVRLGRSSPDRVIGTTGVCTHDPPRAFGSPNGAFPTSDGGTVVTEISGDWVDRLDRRGRLVGSAHPPGFSYPSDTNEVRPGLFVSADYASPGAIETFDARGRSKWRFAPTGTDALDHPSLAMPLPNGDFVANDDYNDRVVVIDPRRNKIVWQYGHTGVAGSRPGYLNTPDGIDLAPPFSLLRRFRRASPPR
jgi:DNA-binding beta-propeller fold protein YncE